MILHTVNTSPTSPAFVECMAIVAATDAVLLMGDGVYAALAGTVPCNQLQECEAAVYVLRADAAGAGVSGQLADSINVIDMDGFVALSEDFPRQQAWY